MAIEILNLANETWFKISNHDTLRPFFMNIVSDSNHWMFISSNGGLTAGRKNNKYALFPYYTDDKITDLADVTGSKTIIRTKSASETLVWEPFSHRNPNNFSISRNIFKNFYGNKIMFEEVNHDLGLTFKYQWNSSNLYGFVRTSTLENNSSKPCTVEVLDGIQNILPYGIEPDLQTRSSNLADAYKRTELVTESGLGIFALSAIIVDKAEPSEALKANVVWSLGIERPKILLSSLQLDEFRKNQSIHQESDIKGEKGAYFVSFDVNLEGSKSKQWKIIANVNQNHAQIVELNQKILLDPGLDGYLQDDIASGSTKLQQLLAGADGLKYTSDILKDSRHFSNVLFNIMRGGTFDDNYQIEKQDFVVYLQKAGVDVIKRNQKCIDGLNDIFNKNELYDLLLSCDDPDFYRLSKEYLPLKFSRRHGDPSRPWNQFSINTHNEIDGSKILDYQGNWRDIFQNWEALVHSYPGFIEGMVFKFLNASTFDGYNPYRVTKGGFDWETIEPDNPWSYIGYWGDHQVIYLLKFLEFYQKYDPTSLKSLFDHNYFVYANVPYRIKSYEQILLDPKNTIDFDEKSDHEIRKKVSKKGADGALLGNKKVEIHHVNFLEKILATVLAKVSNFIPEGGIWMNTQRPEWNDANNALVGNGVSMVTLYYLRRFMKFFEEMLGTTQLNEFEISAELYDYFDQISQILDTYHPILSGSIDDINRKKITDALGRASSAYRVRVYENGFSGDKKSVSIEKFNHFVTSTLDFLEHSIEANRRFDDLYHAYNLMSADGDGISISRLSEMLEGQVAVLSSGYLSTKDAVLLLDALRKSKLYREDQSSYMLYPNKELPGFLQKNTISKESVAKSRLLTQLIDDRNTQIVTRDVVGDCHFNGNFRNASDVREALENLRTTEYGPLVDAEFELVLQIFEEVFNHKSFTGRSGTFYAYEGLGSIYWHMVSKLHVAAQEVYYRAIKDQPQDDLVSRLKHHYYEIGEGIGIHKTPARYGAFPTDPYSHTPFHRGAQQPGMTGQVKEDILVQIGEFGLHLDAGTLHFSPSLLRKEEFTEVPRTIDFIDVKNHTVSIELAEKSLAFSFCQVPVIYRISSEDAVEITFKDGSTKMIHALKLDESSSQMLFERSGEIIQIQVSLRENHLN